MRVWDDLRFVIGIFFLLVTGVLLVGGDDADLNRFAAALMGTFAMLMLALTFIYPLKKKKR